MQALPAFAKLGAFMASDSSQTQARYKEEAARYAVRYVESGMTVGLGTGSTAIYAVREIARRLREGLLTDLRGFATSRHIQEEARAAGIPLLEEEGPAAIDVTIDGADEVDPALNLIKGGGGALLREKIVAQASRREIIVADESKISPRLGTRHALPVEVIPFGSLSQQRFLESLGGRPVLRMDGERPFLTDQGNIIFDCAFGPIPDVELLAAELRARTGIVEHGLFLGLTDDLIVAGPSGVRHLRWDEDRRAAVPVTDE